MVSGAVVIMLVRLRVIVEATFGEILTAEMMFTFGVEVVCWLKPMLLTIPIGFVIVKV